MTDNRKSHWQIKTVPIKEQSEDKLSHSAIAELLDEKINYLFEEDNVPSCICLNGEYGSGKSTIINLLFQKWKMSTNKKVVHFNIWRHKEENTYYALFRNIFYALKNKSRKDFRDPNFVEAITESDEILDMDSEFSELVYSSFSKKRLNHSELEKGISNFISNIPRYSLLLSKALAVTLILGSLLISIIVGLVNLAFVSDFNASFVLACKVFFASLLSGSAFSVLSKNIFKSIPTLFKFHIQPSEESISLPSITNTEQLQCVFMNIISKHSKSGGERLVIVIEDVDRKHNNEIIDTLNELRTFIDLGKAIFVIPCDINNIERAFHESAIDKSNDIDEQYIRWKAKDFCRKIFSHTISLPPQGLQDLRIFLLNKINTESLNNPLKEFLAEEQDFEQLIDILLVSSIKTPREAINIYNRFTLQIEHALKLEENSTRLNKGTISNNLLQYARLYILSTYFGLEKHLLNYPELPNWIMNTFRTREIHYENKNQKEEIHLGEEIPKYAHRYYKNLVLSGTITLELEEFISRTEIYDSPLAKTFIYLDEISYSGDLGSAIYIKVVNSLRSRSKSEVISLLADDEKHISQLVWKLLSNINYSSDFNTYVPSLIDIISYIHPEYQNKVANFVLEHFSRITNNVLYGFSCEDIEKVFTFGSEIRSIPAKTKYFSVLHMEQDAVTEYCSEDKVFEICLMLIKAIDKNKNYVDGKTKSLIGDITSVELPETEESREYTQRSELLQVIRELEDSTILELFSIGFLNRIIDDFDKFIHETEQFEEIKVDTSRLINIFLEQHKSDTLNIINRLSEFGDAQIDSFFINLVSQHFEQFKERVELLKVLESIGVNEISYYLTEESYENSKEHIKESIELFARLDGYAFHNLKTKATKPFIELKNKICELIQSHESTEFLDYVYELIDLHEKEASYTYFGLVFDPIVEIINTNVVDRSLDLGSHEYNSCESSVKFLSRNDRVSRLNEENIERLKQIIMTRFQTHLSQNNANTDSSKALLNLVETLNFAPGFSSILASWIDEERMTLQNNVSFSNYKDYLELVDLVIDEISVEYLETIITASDYLISHYPNDESKTKAAWRWVTNTIKKRPDLDYIENSMIPKLISKISKVDFYKKWTHPYLIEIMSGFSPYEDAAQQSIFNEFLILVLEESQDFSSYIDKHFSYLLNSSIKCNHYAATRTSDCPVNNS